MNDEELDKLYEIFYTHAPYDYILVYSEKRPKHLRGVCIYDAKACILYAPGTYYDGLWVMLHELAHSLVQHKTHSETWDKQFTELLDMYDYPKHLVSVQAEAIGPNLKRWAES